MSELLTPAGHSRPEILGAITHIVRKAIGPFGPTVLPDDHLIEKHGCDAIDIVNIVMTIEEHFAVEITDDDSAQCETTGQLAELVMRRLADAGTRT